ncbi:MAG: hypothetical protein QOD06_3321 [Candidatus Binatota bacterium]|jgi:hypothetical protein|nr:hypothetical protein [Candidatus Binatota bacterium]
MASIPAAVARRIRERARQNKALVITIRDGKPSRVYGFDEYLKMKALPQKVRPWTHRRDAKPVDPLGASPGRVRSRLRRADIYE